MITVFAGRPPRRDLTAWDAAAGFGPDDDVVGSRRAEDARALALVGAAPVWLPFLDSQYGAAPDAAAIAAGLERAIARAGALTVLIPLGLWHSDAEGPFNIVGKGVLPYTTVLALLGRVPIPMPQLVARPLTKVLWATQVVGSPPSFLDFLLYLCVADGARAKRELGFSAQLSIKRTILDFLGVAPEDGATDVARAQA